jgi:phytoene dehydrogenase-like protein
MITVNGQPDAVVVGAGPNGLAAALRLAAAGLRVRVVERNYEPGGGMRSDALTLPGFVHDLCSAAHPMAAASPFFREFDLASRGVRLLFPRSPTPIPWRAGAPPLRCRRWRRRRPASGGTPAATAG